MSLPDSVTWTQRPDAGLSLVARRLHTVASVTRTAAAWAMAPTARIAQGVRRQRSESRGCGRGTRATVDLACETVVAYRAVFLGNRGPTMVQIWFSRTLGEL